MTPEERAEQVWDIIGAHPDDPTNNQDYSTIIGVIAAAIRAAEAEVLERAAVVATDPALKKTLVGSPEFMWGVDQAMYDIGAALRARKGKAP